MSKRINHVLKSTPGTHYTTAIAANGGVETESFPGLRSDGQGCIESIAVNSLENLDWCVEVQDYDGNILNRHLFAATDATQTDIGGTVYYVYYKTLEESWGVPLIQKYDTTPVGLRNMSTTAKTAGASGAVTVILNVKK